MGHSLEGDLLGLSNLDHHWSYAGWDVRRSEGVFAVTESLPEDEIICRPLGPWRKEPEEKLVSISEGGASNIGSTQTCRGSFSLLLIGRSPDQDGPMSQSTSGMLVPST